MSEGFDMMSAIVMRAAKAAIPLVAGALGGMVAMAWPAVHVAFCTVGG